MKNLTNHLFYIVSILILMIFLFNECNKQPEVITKTETELIIDSVEVIITKEVFVPYDSIIKIPAPDLTDADSASIAMAYIKLHSEHFILKKYNEVFKDDSIAFISIETHVEQNSLTFQEVTYKNRVATQINTTTHIYQNIPAHQFFIGLDVSPISFSPGLDYIRNEKHQFTVGYDIANKLPVIGYSYRVFKRK